MGTVEALLILSVTSIHLAVAARGIGPDELMPDTELGSGVFKQGGQVPLGVGETVGERKAVVGLNTLHCDIPATYHFISRFRKSAEE